MDQRERKRSVRECIAREGNNNENTQNCTGKKKKFGNTYTRMRSYYPLLVLLNQMVANASKNVTT